MSSAPLKESDAIMDNNSDSAPAAQVGLTAAPPTIGGLDSPFTITTFTSVRRTTGKECSVTLRDLEALARDTVAQTKEKLPLLKLARFGRERSDRGSLRHDGNVVSVTGIEGDYDGGVLSFDAACAALSGVLALVYTTPSHTKEKPRWRVICPTSRELPPSERARLVDVLNAMLGGVLSRESWAISQIFYCGHLTDAADFAATLLDGAPIDTLPTLPTLPGTPARRGRGRPLGKTAKAKAGDGWLDTSRSAEAYRVGRDAVWNDADFNGMCAAIRAHSPALAAWCDEKGHSGGDRELKRIFDKAQGGLWQKRFFRSKGGGIIPHVENVSIALNAAAELKGCFGFDEMEWSIVLQHPLPHKDGELMPRPFCDNDVTTVTRWLQRDAGFGAINKTVVLDAIINIADENKYHPVRDYLNALSWDGTPRTGMWLHTYFGVEATPYAKAIGQMFLISMVARIMQPGCQVDYMLILEGGQGELKSSACRALASDEWFSDGLPKIGQNLKDLSQHWRGKWLIEMPELSSMRESKSEDIKSFITRRTEKYRPPYGNVEVVEKRQGVLIGSTNKPAYLKDDTGGRRFWPVKIGNIDIEALKRDRDQLFAEAVALYNAKTPWWPNRAFELEHITPEQEARSEQEAWCDPIAEYLEREKLVEKYRKGETINVKTMMIYYAALQGEKRDFDNRKRDRIATAMLQLGWERSRTGGDKRWIPGPRALSAAAVEDVEPPKKWS